MLDPSVRRGSARNDVRHQFHAIRRNGRRAALPTRRPTFCSSPAILPIVGRNARPAERTVLPLRFSARCLLALAIFMKPIVAPAAAVLLGGAGARRTLSAAMAAPCRPVRWLPAGVLDGAAQLGLWPCLCAVQLQRRRIHSAGDAAVGLCDGDARRASSLDLTRCSARSAQLADWLSGPAESYWTIPLNAAGVAILIYVVVRGRQFDPWLRLIGAAALAQHAVALFYRRQRRPLSFPHLVSHHAGGAWSVLHEVGIAWLRRRYPALSRALRRAPAVATACIRPHAAAKECGMSKKPTGIANGLTNYGDRDFSLYLRRSFAQSMGYSRAMLEKPVVGIAYTASGFNNCHRHFPELLDAVKRGVLAAGALPIEFPTISLGEVFLTPTSLKFRNLMSMDTEEMIRAQPMDAVVLMGGCDKTVPAQLMGAVSAGRPAIMLVAGPMMTGRHRGERLGACTDCRRFWAQYRAGKVDDEEISEVEGQLAMTAGTCAVMGTASTMACLAEALGMILPGTAAIPAVHADRLRAAEATGALAVKLIGSQLTPDNIVNAKVGRERAARAARDRRLDQRHHPSDRDRRPRRRASVAASSSTNCPTRRRCW